jgi:hypothetical protein
MQKKVFDRERKRGRQSVMNERKNLISIVVTLGKKEVNGIVEIESIE